MKKIILFLVVISLISCDKNDEQYLDVNVPVENITFEPIPGGALLNYKIPKNLGIYAIKAEYLDYKGRNVTVQSTYLSQQLSLHGFINATENIPIKVSYLDVDGAETKVQKLSFNVDDCVARKVLNSVEVSTFWSGFAVRYECEDEPNGLIHIAKVGVDHFTGEIDTLLIETAVIKEGQQCLEYGEFADENNMSKVVVWTEDFRGNIIPNKKFSEIEASIAEVLQGGNAEEGGFWQIEGPSVEDESVKLGMKYLYDGDTKNIQKALDSDVNNCYMFCSPSRSFAA